MSDDIRDVFRDPQPGDVIRYYGDTYTVFKIERHPGKTVVRVRVNGTENRTRGIAMESWREYRDEADVMVNGSICAAFD